MGTWRIIKNTEKNRGSWNLSDFVSPLNGSGVNFEVYFSPNSGTTQSGQCDNCWSKFFDIEYTDDDNAKATTTYELPYCYVDPGPQPPEPETQYTFEVDFDGLSEGFSHDNLGKTYTIRVTSGTRSDSSAPYVWQPVSYNFSKTLSNNASFGLVDNGQQGGDQTVHGYMVVLNGTPNNEAVSNIALTLTQNDSNNHSSQTFDFRAEEAPTYEQIRIVPYIAVEQYQNPPGSDQHNRYSFQFRTVNESNPTQSVPVNTDLYFMVNDVDTLKVFANGKATDTYDCQSSSCSNENQFIVTGSNGLKNTWKISNGGWSTYQNIDLITGIDAFASLSECCKYTYQTNNILVRFNKTKNTQNSVIGVLNGLPSEANYIVEGNKQYWLDLSQQTQYIDGGQNNFYFSYIEAFDTHNIIKLTSQVTFNARQINEVSVSIYEDGAVFVESAPEGVATVNERFQDITQFVQQVYPNDSYTSIDACGLFNGVDLGEHCINNIVIQDGELVRSSQTLDPSVLAMHIELDNNN